MIGIPSGEREPRGFTLLEVVIALTLGTVIILGVMASISGISVAERNASEVLQSQLLLSRVMEEIQSNPFATLPSFSGQLVVSGNHRASITVNLLSAELARVQVAVTSTMFPDVTSNAVLLLADTQ